VVGEDLVGARASRPGTRCGSSSTSAARAAPATRSRRALRAAFDVQVELATQATIVLVLGLDQPLDALERFTHDLASTVAQMARPGDGSALSRSPSALVNEVAASPREAFLGETEVVHVSQADGRISAEAIAGYPPGIPALLPGERITTELVRYLRELAGAGARLHGASDPGFETITVLR
jgi:lysine decarboxylase